MSARCYGTRLALSVLTILAIAITAVLINWSSLLNLNEDLPLPARKAGLLALHLLAPLKESYRDDGDRKKLFSIIIKTIPAIHAEFLRLLNADVFAGQEEEPIPLTSETKYRNKLGEGKHQNILSGVPIEQQVFYTCVETKRKSAPADTWVQLP